MIKAALIGCGARGRDHAAAFASVASCRLAALSDIDGSRAEALNQEFSFGAAVYQDHREMLAAERPEAAAIALWPGLHLPVLKDCVEAGVRAVLCEKPMAPTWQECQEMARIAEESGIILAFSHQRRYAKGCRLVRRLMAEGVLGQILQMNLFSPPNTLDCGTHTFDQAMSFMEEAKPKWVLGAVDGSAPIGWFGVEADCVAAGLVVFENGVRASLQFGGPDMDIWGGVRITGEKGFVEVMWDGQIRKAVIYSRPEWTCPDPGEDAMADHMRGYVEDVLSCMARGGEPDASWRRALQASELIFAFYESARIRARIELPLAGVTGNPFHQLLESGALDEARALGRQRQAAEA